MPINLVPQTDGMVEVDPSVAPVEGIGLKVPVALTPEIEGPMEITPIIAPMEEIPVKVPIRYEVEAPTITVAPQIAPVPEMSVPVPLTVQPAVNIASPTVTTDYSASPATSADYSATATGSRAPGAQPQGAPVSGPNVVAATSEFLKPWEGFRADPYWDVKQWTQGYGTRAPQGASSAPVTESQANLRL